MKKILPIFEKAIFRSLKCLINISLTCLLLLSSGFWQQSDAQTVMPNIRLDQFGYPVNARKIAVISNPINGYNNTQTFIPGSVYQVKKVSDNSIVYTGMPAAWKGGILHTQSGDKVWWFDFSNLTTSGSYYILDVEKNVKSYEFNIGDDVYDNVAKAATKMFYYNRRGFAKSATYAGIWADNAPAFNNANQDLEARLISDKTNAATAKDVSGGWFDAGDYNKYVTFAFTPLSDMLLAYEEKPIAWSDATNIPESGNYVPDLLDEVKWELDWLLKMQNSNGSLMSKVGNAVGQSMNALPPSAITVPQYYGAASTSATLTGAMAFALGAIQYKSLTSNSAMVAYGNSLQTAAINAWNWSVANPNVLFVNAGNFDSADAEIDNYSRNIYKMCAAVYLFALTGDNAYKTYIDANYETFNSVKPIANYTIPYEQHLNDAVLYYAKTLGATPSVATNIKTRLGNIIKNQLECLPSFKNQEDAYRSFLKDGDHNWGSTKIKSSSANNLGSAILNNLDATNTERYREASIGYIHYIHGTNPLGFSFLTNMGILGAENSVTKMYHFAFGASSSFSGNTPPGYLVGGVNKNYQPDAAYTGPLSALTPPLGQPVAKTYKDWDTSWPENSWSLTEPAIYYQAAYLRMLSKAMGGIPAAPADAVAPSTPTALSRANLLPNSFTLNWGASTDNVDVVAYEIYSNGIKILESTTNVFYFNNIPTNTTYVFTVKAKDRAGNLSLASNTITVTTPDIDTEAPSIPTGLAIINTTQVSTIITWTASTDNLGVAEYEVFKNGVSIGVTQNLVMPATGLTANTTYNFTVKAKDASGNVSAASTPLSVLTANTPSLDKVLYDETILSGWSSVSWSTVNYASTNPKKTGTVAAKSTHTDNWQAIGFEGATSNDFIYTALYPKGIGFWAYAEGTGNAGYYIKIFDVNGVENPEKQFSVPAGTWTYIQISWAELGNPTTVKRLWLQGNGTSTGRVVNFDNMRFLYNDPVLVTEDAVLYDEAILENWNDWNSYNNTRDLNSTTPTPKVGIKAFKVTSTTSYNALVFTAGVGADTIKTSDYPKGFGFWAYNEGTDAINTKIQTENFAGTASTIVEKLVPAGVWTYVRVSWAELGNPTQVKKVIMQDLSGKTNNIKNYDDIRFLVNEPVTVTEDKVLYNEAILTNWNDWDSYTNTRDLNSTIPTPKVGLKAMKVTSTGAYGAVVLKGGVALDAINTADYPKGIGFWAYNEGTDAINTKIQTENFAGTASTIVQKLVPAGTWSFVRVTWAELGNPTQVWKVIIQDLSGKTNNVKNYDDIKFLLNEPPAITSNQVIYDDALGMDWQNWSYDAGDWDFNNTTLVKQGTKSIKGAPAGTYKSASFNKATVVNTSNHPGGIGFWAYGNRASGTNTQAKIKVFTQATSTGTETVAKSVDLPMGTWTYVNVTWADLGNPTSVQRVTVQDISGTVGQVFYMDDIQLLAATPTTVANVTFSPAGGIFSTAQNVSLATTTAGATIRYTTDGSTPTETVGTIYSSAINVATTTTIKAIAYKSGSIESAVSSATYTITAIPATNQVIYDDALGMDWQNWSYDAGDWDFNNTTLVKQGAKSIKGAPAGTYKSASFNKATVVNTSNHPGGIGFWAYGNTASGTNTQAKIKVFTQATSTGTETVAKSVDLPLGTWTYVNVTWADLGNPTSVQRVTVQDISGTVGQVFYMDDIQLLAATPTTVANVTFSPAGGTFATAQNVSLATVTAGATIRYTTDGSTPTETVGTIYSSAINVESTTTIKAIAYKAGSIESAVTSETYTIVPVVANVTFSPAGGIFSTAQNVSLSTVTAGATIRYTTDGSTPTQTVGTIYTGAINVATTATIKVIAYKSGSTASAVTSETYTIVPVVANVTFSPAGGIFSTAQNVSLSTVTAGATIRYTTDGSTPTETVGTIYSSAINVATTATIKVIAYKSGSTASAVTSSTYTIVPVVANVTFSPAGGIFSTAQNVSLSTVTAGATIRYTTDGSTPTETVGTIYTGAINVATTATIKAIAYKSGSTASAVTSETYTIVPIVYNFETVKNGDWSDPTVWLMNAVPTIADNVLIKHTVTISTNVQAKNVGYMGGVINFLGNFTLSLGL
jgi:endoglucanase